MSRGGMKGTPSAPHKIYSSPPSSCRPPTLRQTLSHDAAHAAFNPRPTQLNDQRHIRRRRGGLCGLGEATLGVLCAYVGGDGGGPLPR